MLPKDIRNRPCIDWVPDLNTAFVNEKIHKKGMIHE